MFFASHPSVMHYHNSRHRATLLLTLWNPLAHPYHPWDIFSDIFLLKIMYFSHWLMFLQANPLWCTVLFHFSTLNYQCPLWHPLAPFIVPMANLRLILNKIVTSSTFDLGYCGSTSDSSSFHPGSTNSGSQYIRFDPDSKSGSDCISSRSHTSVPRFHNSDSGKSTSSSTNSKIFLRLHPW